MNLELEYEPGDIVWAWSNEPVHFEHKGVKSVRYAPGRVVQAKVRFVEIIVSSFQTQVSYQIDFGKDYRMVSVEQIHADKEEAEKARQELMSGPAYNWMRREND